MRPTLIAALLALLVASMPLALAGAHHERGHDDDDDAADDNEGRRGPPEAGEARGAERAAERAAWHENRTAAIEGFKAGMKALRASWHENATGIRESCQAAAQDENATEDDKKVGHCIRDGYKGWRELHRDDFTALKDALRAFMKMGRGHGAD